MDKKLVIPSVVLIILYLIFTCTILYDINTRLENIDVKLNNIELEEIHNDLNK